MGYEVIRREDGGVVMIACRRGGRAARCQVPGCVNNHTALCDYPLGGIRADATCDMRLCGSHRVPQPDRDRDYCPTHAKGA
ncbi:MAG TPA: hypothetical protein VMV27_02060 [Candidatus Binataceae bacterium]|nr:hypothetical protein [Candidatus Binataceae bacterium]